MRRLALSGSMSSRAHASVFASAGSPGRSHTESKKRVSTRPPSRLGLKFELCWSTGLLFLVRCGRRRIHPPKLLVARRLRPIIPLRGGRRCSDRLLWSCFPRGWSLRTVEHSLASSRVGLGASAGTPDSNRYSRAVAGDVIRHRGHESRAWSGRVCSTHSCELRIGSPGGLGRTPLARPRNDSRREARASTRTDVMTPS